MSPSPDTIVQTVLDTFNALPSKRKPRRRDDGSFEWVPLSGIVLSHGPNDLKCVAIGTGSKCLPTSKLALSQGQILHDWHAEILAIRSFNNFLIQECLSLSTTPTNPSKYVRRRSETELSYTHSQPFTIKEDTQIHMYCSEAPCGDASMELTMEAQEDATPWPTPSSSSSITVNPSSPASAVPVAGLHGRGHFSSLGIVRRKPSRPDAPPTLSKSCSDKLSLKTCISLLSSSTSVLISPFNAYLHTLTLPSSQYSSTACSRAFGPQGRMAPLVNKQWEGGYRYRSFEIMTTSREFEFSRRGRGKAKLVASNLSAVWTTYGQETLVNGVLQGRRLGDAKGGSMICRKGIWKVVGEVIAVLGVPLLRKVYENGSYVKLKAEEELLEHRREVKAEVKREALKGWISNQRDDFDIRIDLAS
ncbi:MAG: hypothetical protein M1812_002671 [Candelaria pacifica]|nr:MAG: hypothetical protein M1812_002671 [Candelaria pacifica]